MIKKYKPSNAAVRQRTVYIGPGHNVKPSRLILKSLTAPLKGPMGRSKGKVSVEQKCRGVKKRYRIIDFKRSKYKIEGVVESIQYDPNRACDIALILYKDGERRFILCPAGLSIGDKVVSDEKTSPSIGNAMALKNIQVGLPIHNVELYPHAGGKFIRSAGNAGYIMAKDAGYVDVKMPSGEIRKFLENCFATIGQVGAEEWKLVSIGKAGLMVKRGVRPTVRGKTRSYGHPLSGSYKRRVGRHPVDKWGNLSKGKKTRKRKYTDKYIVKRKRS